MNNLLTFNLYCKNNFNYVSSLNMVRLFTKVTSYHLIDVNFIVKIIDLVFISILFFKITIFKEIFHK